MIVFIGIEAVTSTPAGKPRGSVKAAAAPSKLQPIDGVALTQSINNLISNSNLEVGVAMTDLTNNLTYNYGLSSTPYVAASTSKVMSAILFLHELENGQAKLTDSIGGSPAQDQLSNMIVNSDNDAWQAFNDFLTHPALEQYAQSVGIDDYVPDDNTITADDLASLLTKLYQRKLLNPADTKLLLSYMKAANETEYIVAALPSGTSYYHKAGYLDDRAMDAAIINNGKHPFVLVIFTKDPSGSYDQVAGQRLFHQLTATALGAFAK